MTRIMGSSDAKTRCDNKDKAWCDNEDNNSNKDNNDDNNDNKWQ